MRRILFRWECKSDFNSKKSSNRRLKKTPAIYISIQQAGNKHVCIQRTCRINIMFALIHLVTEIWHLSIWIEYYSLHQNLVGNIYFWKCTNILLKYIYEGFIRIINEVLDTPYNFRFIFVTFFTKFSNL